MEITSTQLKARQGQYLMEAIRQPIKISLRGRTTHVLMSIEEYEKLQERAGNVEERKDQEKVE